MHSTRKKEELEVIKLCRATSTNMSIMDFEGLGTDMDEDDSDKEFDIPIDPVWEAQQMRTFTAWCNAHLRRADMKIEVFEQDFRNGLKLMKLLEIISNDTLPPPDRGKMRFHKLANVNKALKFIEDKGVKLASVGAEEIVDGNIKMTLGMVWTIILRFTIQDILVEDSSAKDGLLLWCKRKTSGYKNIDVANFKKSFQNGLAFCALIHSHDPQLIDYDSLSPMNSKHNLDLAFGIADKNLDVPQMLSVEDMVNSESSDERSIMAYVSSYYHTFSKKNKMSEAICNINEIVTAKMKEDRCAHDYEEISNNLLKWIERVIQEFESRGDIDDPCSMVSALERLEKYKSEEKPENISYQIQLQVGSLNVPALMEKYDEVMERWKEMERLEFDYEIYVSEQRRREEDIERLLKKLEVNYQIMRVWIGNQLKHMVSKDYETANLGELRTLARVQENFISTMGSMQLRTDKIVSICDHLRRLRYKDMKTVNEKVETIVTPWDTLANLNAQRIKLINVHIDSLSRMDDLHLEFAKKATYLNNWMQQANEDLNEKFEIHILDEIKEAIGAHERFKMTLEDVVRDVAELRFLSNKIEAEVANLGRNIESPNPYTDLLMSRMQTFWEELVKGSVNKDEFLRETLLHRSIIANYLVDFQEKVDRLTELFADIRENIVKELQIEAMSTEQTVATLHVLQEKLNQSKNSLEDLESAYRKLDSESQTDRIQSVLSYRATVATQETLSQVISVKLTALNSADGREGESKNKVNDYETCFQHFDRTNCGQLELPQFRACLVSLGLAPEGGECKDDKYFEQIVAEVDPQHSEVVTLERFLRFVDRWHGDRQGAELLLESFRVLSDNQTAISSETLRKDLRPAVADYCLDHMQEKTPPSSMGGLSSTTAYPNSVDYVDFVGTLFRGVPPRQP